MSRFAALYTSLSTSYSLIFDNHTATVAPFVTKPDFRLGMHESIKNVSFRREPQKNEEARLSGFTVDSNTTGMVHSEQMFDMGGAWRLAGDENQGLLVSNGTPLPLRQAGVLRRLPHGQLQAAWIGELKPKNSAPLNFQPINDDNVRFPQWEESPVTAQRTAADGELKLDRLFSLAAGRLRLLRGETRLIGWTDMHLPGVRYQPEASQAQRRTLVLVHLQQGELPGFQSDANLKIDLEADVQEDDSMNLADPVDPAELDRVR
jgi:hypothetical protein